MSKKVIILVYNIIRNIIIKRQLTYIFLIINLLALPLLFYPGAIDSFTIPRLLLASVTVVFYLVFLLLNKNPKLYIFKAPQLIFWSFFIIFIALSGINVINSAEYFITLSAFITYGVIFFTIILIDSFVSEKANNNFNSETNNDNLSTNYLIISGRVASIAGFVLAVIGICQFYNIAFNDIPGTLGPFGTMGRRNLFASWLFLSMPFIIINIISGKNLWIYFSYISFSLCLFAILLSQARADWVALAITFIVFMVLKGIKYIFSFKEKLLITLENPQKPFDKKDFEIFSFSQSGTKNSLKKSINSRIFVLTILTALIVIISFSFQFTHRLDVERQRKVSLTERAESMMHLSVDSSAHQRFLAWNNSYKMIKDNWLLGVGAGNWKINMPKYGLGGFFPEAQTGYLVYSQPHNDFISVICETGIFGLICYLLFFLSSIYYAIKTFFKTDETANSIISAVIACFLVGYMAIAFVDFPKDRPEHNILIIFLSAFTILLNKDKFKKIEFKSIYIYFLLLMSIISIFVFAIRLNSETNLKPLYQARADHNWDKVMSIIDKSYNETFESLDPFGTPLLFYKGEASYMSGQFEKALKLYQIALIESPNNFHTMNDIGTCFVKLNDLQKAKEFYNKALNISPNFEDALVNMAAIHYNEGNYSKAYEFISKCNYQSKNSNVKKFYDIIHSQIEGVKH